ncbi:MAG: hypothetical protein ACOCXG_01290 [Nanoarchaeota archaeon]
MLQLERETTWIEEDASKIHMIGRNLLEDRIKTKNIIVESPNNSSIKVNSDVDFDFQFLSEMFCSSEVPKNSGEIYFIRSKDKSLISEYDSRVRDVKTQCFGLYDSVNGVGLIIGGTGYGLVKSVLIGLSSFLNTRHGFFPAHGAAVEKNTIGSLLVGSHGAGKTTTLMHLMHYYGNAIKVLTDDWTISNRDNDGVNIFPLERNLSFKGKFVEEFPHLDLGKWFLGHKREGVTKAYIDPDEIYGRGTKISKSQLRNVIVLDPRNGNLIQNIDVDLATRILIEGTYHMPDSDLDLKRKMFDFWYKTISDCNLISFDSRHTRLKSQEIYAQLYELL